MIKPNLRLETFLPYRLSYISNLMGQELAKLYTDKFGIAHTEWRVMAVLGVSSGVSAAYVADKTAMDKVAVSRAIKNMIENGLISRSFADEDKRRSELCLSSLGNDTYEKIAPLVQEYEKGVLESLDQTEQDALDKLLSKLTSFVSPK